jgi:hypothetical protein
MSNYPSYQPPPQSLANLRPFQAGESGNPGGNYKRTPKISNALARLMSLSDADFNAYEPQNKADKLAHRLLDLAEKSSDLKELVAAFREIADRTEGKPLQTKVVEHTVSPETRQAIVIEAYTSLFYNRTREQSLASINAIHDAIEAQRDRNEVKELVQVAVQEDSEGISAVWVDAEKAVTGSG